MAGLNGSEKETRSSPISFIELMACQYVLRQRSAATLFERVDEAEGFWIVTAAADQGLVDIHDRRPLVLGCRKQQRGTISK